MKTYAFVLPVLLLAACGFSTVPYDGDGEPPTKAEDIARLRDSGEGRSAVDAGEENSQFGTAGRDARGAISDSEHLLEDGGHLEPDDAGQEPVAYDAATTPLPDAAVLVPDAAAVPDAALGTAACQPCQTSADCGPTALCMAGATMHGLCMIRLFDAARCLDRCDGQFPQASVVPDDDHNGFTVCLPADSDRSYAQACAQFLAEGRGCN